LLLPRLADVVWVAATLLIHRVWVDGEVSVLSASIKAANVVATFCVLFISLMECIMGVHFLMCFCYKVHKMDAI